jgi:hypothetical protein
MFAYVWHATYFILLLCGVLVYEHVLEKWCGREKAKRAEFMGERILIHHEICKLFE